MRSLFLYPRVNEVKLLFYAYLYILIVLCIFEIWLDLIGNIMRKYSLLVRMVVGSNMQLLVSCQITRHKIRSFDNQIEDTIMLLFVFLC